MKIIAVLENEAIAGGGFNQAMSAILQMRRLCAERFEFEVFARHDSSVATLRELGMEAQRFSFAWSDRVVSYLGFSPWWAPLQRLVRITGALEKKLIEHGCDLAYFVTPSDRSTALQRVNFVTTLWDLCHRDHPEFPEVRELARFQDREHQYRTRLARAFLVLTDSRVLSDTASSRYGIDRDRFLPMPFSPSPFLGQDAAAKADVLRKFGVEEGYFFYPAQLWAHKNHMRILEALAILAGRGARPNVVFAGGDMGNRAHLEGFARRNGLTGQVHFLGFVDSGDMRGLYDGCGAVLMPTYFGPTNLPPLEAWSLGKPLIYSSHLREQAGAAALFVDVNDAESLAGRMLEAQDSRIRESLVAAGRERLEEIDRQRGDAESELLGRLSRFEAMRLCWA